MITKNIATFVLSLAVFSGVVAIAPHTARADGSDWYDTTSYYNSYDVYAPSYGSDWYDSSSYYNSYDVYSPSYGSDWYDSSSYYNSYDVYEPYYSDWYDTTSYYNSYDVYEPYYSDWYDSTSYYNSYDVYEPYYNDYAYWNDEPYYNQPYGDYIYEEYYVDYVTDYDYWYDTPRYNPPHYDPPRRDYDRPNCVISVSDETPEEGDSITITWDTWDTDHATLTGFGEVDEDGGSERIRVSNDRTFTLRVEGPGGSDSCSIDIEVEEDRDRDRDRSPWCELDASDTSIEEGESTTLEWDTRGDVRDARINQGIGSVDEDGGTKRVRPTRDTTYRLTVEDRDGDEYDCDVTVRVDEDDSIPPPPDVPLVYLSQLPYTGAGDTMMYWMLVIVGSGLAGYALFFRAVPFAYARVKALRSGLETSETEAEGTPEEIPTAVTRQDVRAFVSALADTDAASAREFARNSGAVLFAETAVILDDVVRARASGTPADPVVTEMTKGWDSSKFAALIEAFADAKDETAVEKALA